MFNGIKGLTEQEVSLSREKNGDNSLVKEKTKGFIGKFFENLSDPIIRVLLIAVLIEVIFTFGACNWWEVGGIIVAVLIATTVSTVSEYGSEKAFLKMEAENSNLRAKVIRSGELCDINISDIVVGDIIYVSQGEIIPADGEIIYGRLSADQSALNGESREAAKFPGGKTIKGDFSSETDVFRGSVVTEGEGMIRVTRVGKETFYGMVAKDVQTETRESPLKHKLSHLAKQISRLGYFMAATVGFTYLFYAFVVENGYDRTAILASFKDISFTVTTLTHALTLMITVIVVAVPEGLPMMITVVLSANMKRMLEDNVMVKKLVGIETAGSMNMLFTDKTGTLTTGKTTLERIITCDGTYKNISQLKKNKEVYSYLFISAKEGSSEIKGSSLGNSTDKAFFEFFKNEKEKVPAILDRTPFSSDRKYSSVTLSSGIKIIRGAPEIVLRGCLYSLCERGVKKAFDAENIYKKYRDAASVGGRVIAVVEEEGNTRTFIAFAVLKDKLRPGVKDAVLTIRNAGVQVVMITGDSRETAVAIAKECGILRTDRGESVITHDEMEKLSDVELMEKLPRLSVVARALPRDKSRLVRLSQELGAVVGMTGDGINDAPSLKLADVGFAMGSGTDIAKGAGDIIILDNSFKAITKTVLYGRTIFKSIRKFIVFQLMMNLAACGISLIGQFIGIENPITIIQMLWINIIMDTLGGLAFAGEAPLDYYMMEKPNPRNEKILSREMLGQILITGGYTLALCFVFLHVGFFSSLFRKETGDIYFLTGFYALFVFSGLFNCFNSRSERMSLFSNISKNKPFLLIMSTISVIQILMIYFGGEVFRSAPLTFRELLNVILLASTVIPFDMIRRVVKKLK
ncbi:MAG: calcium-translocating P-type ATPase, PMCA-type [Clostridia bacterium]|nr:calcium-translocating P-type ATPase, PMCA-type [Clostridia bacterium]